MLKKLIISTVLVVAVLGMTIKPAFAQEKIAVVSLQKALNQVKEGQKIKDSLQKEYETKKKSIDSMKDELEKLGQDLEKQKMVLSAEALQDKRKDLQAKFIELQNKAVSYERELKTKEAQSAQKILGALRDIVIDISKKEGYTLVIENSTETVLYSKTGEDITDKVIAAYDKK